MATCGLVLLSYPQGIVLGSALDDEVLGLMSFHERLHLTSHHRPQMDGRLLARPMGEGHGENEAVRCVVGFGIP